MCCLLRAALPPAPPFPLRENSFKEMVHEMRIGLAARLTHHLPDEEFEDAFVPGAVLGGVLRALRHHLAADALDLAGVAHLRQSFSGDDLLRRPARRKHFSEDFLSALGSYLAAFPAAK